MNQIEKRRIADYNGDRVEKTPSSVDSKINHRYMHHPVQTRTNYSEGTADWTERTRALSFLEFISPPKDRETWIQVGLALYSVDENLLSAWDDWSKRDTNYEPGACEREWKSFRSKERTGIGALSILAKSNWQPPNERSRSNRSGLTTARENESFQATPLSVEESNEDFEELAQEVNSLVRLMEQSAPTQNLLSQHLTIPLLQRAKQFNVPLEAFVSVFLPIAASLLKIGTHLEIDAVSDYRCFPILWTGLVGESGSNKSPILNSLLRPLEELQAHADKKYERENATSNESDDWNQRPRKERRNKPASAVQREYYLKDTTCEAMVACLNTQPDRGIVISNDELAGFLNGFNQYRSKGKGNDRQSFLSAYDGSALKVNRKGGGRISLFQTSISLTGTIQPCVLQKHMSDLEQVDGFWPRFLWVYLPLTEMPPPGEGVNLNLSTVLRDLYLGLESLPPLAYRFDRQGQKIWRNWHVLCERQKMAESNSSLRAIYPKSKERAARIALIVHCINAIAEKQVPSQTISCDVLEAAIAFTEWSIGQTRLIYADAGIVSHEESANILRFIERFKDYDLIKARHVTHCSTSRSKLNAESARELMRKVVALDYAIDNGKTGSHYGISIKACTGKSSGNSSISPHEL